MGSIILWPVGFSLYRPREIAASESFTLQPTSIGVEIETRSRMKSLKMWTGTTVLEVMARWGAPSWWISSTL